MTAIKFLDALVFLAVVLPFINLARNRNAIPLLPRSRDGVTLPDALAKE